MIENVKIILYILTILGQIAVALVWLGWIASRLVPSLRPKYQSLLRALFQGRDVAYVFLISTIATAGSLFFSEVARYTPCLLCWYQRIAMYPLVVIAGMSVFKKQVSIRAHILTLSIIGACLSLYHYLLQIGVLLPTACSDVGTSISCSQRFTLGFGYITISMMALTAFVMIATSMAVGLSLEKRK